jgi:hypothetical protein
MARAIASGGSSASPTRRARSRSRLARAAAFDDPRFPPLTVAELPTTDIEISRLSAAAVAQLATLGASRLGEFAAACRDVCDDCEKECRKHAETHAICKACADSCVRFIAEAKHLTLA